MESDHFDALAARLAQGMSRRRSLGVFGAVGTAWAMAADTEAGKRKKRKNKKRKNPKPTSTSTTPAPQCPRCEECEDCLNGSCQPKADGTACGSGSICVHGGCGVPCTFGGTSCPPDSGLVCPEISAGPRVCVYGDYCDAPICTDQDHCPSGSICIYAPCGTPTMDFRCAQVVSFS